MMRSVTPDRMRIFHIAAWMWLAYLVSLAIVDLFIYARQPISPLLNYYLVNGLPALVFLALAYSRWLHLRGEVLALGLILLITIVPILANPLFNVHLPPAPLSNLEGMILRQLPVLFIALVLVAWHYNLAIMVLYSLGANLFEFVVVYLFGLSEPVRQSGFYFIIIVRTVCFLVVGIFINQLITHLRLQQESLKTANQQLTHYASTLEQLTISRERNRMSRELHDTVVHTLSGLSVQLETAKAYLEANPDTVLRLLENSLDATRSGLQETRRAIKALRATPLDDLGLLQAIHEMVETAAQRGQYAVQVSLPDQDLILSPDVEQCLYRIAQEAIENVVQHACARDLRVHLTAREKEVELLILDDGIGFHPDAIVPAGHYGLAGMKERAKLAGGDLDIVSQPDHGTTIRFVIQGRL